MSEQLRGIDFYELLPSDTVITDIHQTNYLNIICYQIRVFHPKFRCGILGITITCERDDRKVSHSVFWGVGECVPADTNRQEP